MTYSFSFKARENTTPGCLPPRPKPAVLWQVFLQRRAEAEAPAPPAFSVCAGPVPRGALVRTPVTRCPARGSSSCDLKPRESPVWADLGHCHLLPPRTQQVVALGPQVTQRGSLLTQSQRPASSEGRGVSGRGFVPALSRKPVQNRNGGKKTALTGRDVVTGDRQAVLCARHRRP